MERRQVPVLPLSRGDEAQQAEQLQAAGAEPGPRPRLHPAAVRCVDIEFRSSPHPRYPQQREPAPQLHPAVPGGGGRRGRGRGRGGLGVQPRVPAPLHLRWVTASVHTCTSMFVFPSGLWS